MTHGRSSQQGGSASTTTSANHISASQARGQNGSLQMNYAAAVMQSHTEKDGSSSIVNQSTSVSVQTEIETYVDEDDEDEAEEGELEGSWYETNCEQEQYKRLEAADVRRQVREAPPFTGQTKGYPKEHYNDPAQPLKARPQWTEFPIVPSPPAGSPGGNYRRGLPGPVRALYNDADRETFDVGYHDTTRPPTGPREGRQFPRSPFSLATYHPATEKRQASKRS